MKLFTLPTLLVAALFSGTVVIPFGIFSEQGVSQFALEATMTSSAGGVVELYYDSGEGFSQTASVRVPLMASSVPRVYHLSIPAGTYHQFRFDPNDKESVVTIANVKVLEGNSRVLRSIKPTEFKSAHQIGKLQLESEHLTVEITPGADDPQLLLTFVPVLELRSSRVGSWIAIARTVFLPILLIFVTVLAIIAWLEHSVRVRSLLASVADYSRKHPCLAVLCISVTAVLASDYPVVFLGKSYVSPNLGLHLLYDSFPTIPGSEIDHMTTGNGADIGAAIWQHLPMSMVQHRALLDDGELPLWNRFNSCGTPLLGQGQSMFGDPLHFLLILADGAAWAWDLKYLVAKCIFGCALGLTVLTISSHLPAAIIVSLASPFMGFFAYRFNHPAFISFCYAPVVLYCWARIAKTKHLRVAALATALLILGNIALMNSGTVKEAYVLLLCMNFSGVCLLLGAQDSWRSRLLRLAMTVWAGVIFILLTTPVWLTFLNTLKGAISSYDNPMAFQIQPSLLIGLFDEMFYRGLTDGKFVFNPSANFLVLGGVLYFLATLRIADRMTLVLATSALVPLSIAFGFIPSGMIAKIPFLGNIVHVDNTFSCALIILIGVLAGAGYKKASERLGTKEGLLDLRSAGLLLFSLVFIFVAFRQTIHRQALGATFSPINTGREMAIDSFTWGYFFSILSALILLAFTVRHALKSHQLSVRHGVLIALSCLVLLWRFGLHADLVGSNLGPYVIQPSARANLQAPSPAIKLLQEKQRSAPFRSFGIGDNLSPGWSATYGIESISGPDGLINPIYRQLSILPNTGLDLLWAWRLYLRPTNISQRRFLDFLNVKYYLGSNREVLPLNDSLKLTKHADLNVYESTSAWPRAFFTDRLTSYNTPEELLSKILKEDGRPFAAALKIDPTSLRARSELSDNLEGREIIPAQDYHLRSNQTSFSIRVNRPGIIVLSEAYWAGESFAELNGIKVPIVRLNHAFQGILVNTAGTYQVSFSYWPRQFSISLIIGAIGAILLLISLSLAWKIERARVFS